MMMTMVEKQIAIMFRIYLFLFFKLEDISVSYPPESFSLNSWPIWLKPFPFTSITNILYFGISLEKAWVNRREFIFTALKSHVDHRKEENISNEQNRNISGKFCAYYFK